MTPFWNLDETLRKQIDAWTETDEHGRIVDMLGQISPEERDSEATGLLVILDGKEYIVMCVYNDFDQNCFHVFMRRANDNDITYFDNIAKG